MPSAKPKTPVKTEQKAAPKTTVAKPKEGSLSIPVYSLLGKESGTMELPSAIFGAKVNKTLLAQAVRVYSTNQKTLTGSTKTRGEVNLTTKKMYRQKGTGRARHGAQSAPIFVGGGIAFGPKPRKIRLDLPKKMKKAALISALSARAEESLIFGLSGLEKAAGKTKEFASLMDKLAGLQESKKHRSTLIIIGDKNHNVLRGVKNLERVDALTVNSLNAYEVIKHQVLAITQEAIEKLNTKTAKGEEA